MLGSKQRDKDHKGHYLMLVPPCFLQLEVNIYTFVKQGKLQYVVIDSQ